MKQGQYVTPREASEDGRQREKSKLLEPQEIKGDSALRSTARKLNPLCCMQESLHKTQPRHQRKKQPSNAVQKIRVYPCKELHRTWKQWLAGYRWIYNWTPSSAYDLQRQAREASRPNWVKELPGHQLQEAVADAVDATKQAQANQGVAKFKSCRAFSQVIKFKAGNFKNGTWYSRLTKGLSFATKQCFPQQCIYGTQLVYQKGKWYACFPEYREETNSKSTSVIALDPGNRTFLTGYDGETILEIGKKDIGRINRLCTHLDQLGDSIKREIAA